MGLRWILYGYEMVNDRYRVVAAEAGIVRRIFKSYIGGNTFKIIAEELTTKGIIYFESKKTWNKNMVSRILENQNYIGNEKYPAIIDKEIFNAAMTKRNMLGGKRETDSAEMKFLKTHTFCAECGKPYRRVSKHGRREKWFCSGGCKYQHYIDDNVFFQGIIQIINAVISNTNVLQDCKVENTYKADVSTLRKINEVKYMADKIGIRFAPIKQALFESVSSKFDCCILDKSTAYTEPLKKYFRNLSIQTSLNCKILSVIIEKIEIKSDSSIDITLINGQIFNTYERNLNYGNITENSNAYRS